MSSLNFRLQQGCEGAKFNCTMPVRLKLRKAAEAENTASKALSKASASTGPMANIR